MKTMHKALWALWLCGWSPLTQAYDGSTAPVSGTEGASQIIAISAGQMHTCGLKADGGLVCWGDDSYGQSASPAGRFLSVSTNNAHTCGVKADGSVSCWGYNWQGQVSGTPSLNHVPATASHPGPYLSVSAGGYHSCGLKDDGSIACWGAGKADAGVWPNFGQAIDQAGPFIAVSAGANYTCGLKADGAIACWGSNVYGQLDAPQGPFIGVSAGQLHACGLKPNGAVVCWGLDYDGEVSGTPSNSLDPAPPATHAGPYSAVTAGEDKTCALKVAGGVDCWGANKNGEGADQSRSFVYLSAGRFHTCGVQPDGSLACWGAGGPGTSGAFNLGQSIVPAELAMEGASAFGQIAAGNAHACQLRRDGTLGCWGRNDEGQSSPPAGTFTQVVAGGNTGCALDASSTVTCWGSNSADYTNWLGPLGAGIEVRKWRSIAINDNHVQAYSWPTTNPAGTFSWLLACQPGATGCYGWGFDASRGVRDFSAQGTFTHVIDTGGKVLTGYGVNAGAPPDPNGPWLRVEGGLNHACGLKTDGSIECWGSNGDGQTGNVPTGGFRTLSVGYNHACAIRDNGQLACWGSNINGQATPPVGSDTYVQVAAGNTFTCAIRDNGTRVCWGDDAHGQAPQLALSPESLVGGQVGVAHAGATFTLSDAGQNADGDYVPATPVFYADPADLPPGLSLSAAGVLSGTPTASGTFTFTVEGEDANGFTASSSYTITIITDSTPPQIGYTLTPAAPDGSNGWYVSDIGIDWTVSDAESSVSGIIGCVDETLNTDTTGITRSCTASSLGGSASLTTEVLKRDATAPTLAPTTPSPLLRGQSHVASPNASDATSGIASSSCGALDTSSLGSKSTTCSATDNAGNGRTVPLHYTVTTTCANDGYGSTQLQWCVQICESGLTGKPLEDWIKRWFTRYRNYPYCVAP